MKTTQEAMDVRIVSFVVENYLANTQPSTVKEIARALFVSEKKIRQTFEENHGSLKGLRYEREQRESNGPMTNFLGSKVYHVGVYYPTLFKLREMINELRGSKQNACEEGNGG